VDVPGVRYARSGEVSIAYQVVGDGPFDLVWTPGALSHRDLEWEEEDRARFLRALASFSRLIVFDKRGTGLSDRVTGMPDLETRIDAIRAVMDAAVSESAAVCGVSEGGPMALLFAATYPERVRALVTRFVELPGGPHIPYYGDWESVVDAIREFVEPICLGSARPYDSVLATVLFTDLVGSTAKAVELGDRGWRELLEQHHARTRAQLSLYRGIELDTAGDGFFARFDGPARAIRCACAIRDAVAELGLEMRAGLHTGECEVLDGTVAGVAVSIGARVAAQAGPGEVLVSQTVKDLVAGSGIEFEDRWRAELKGLPGEWGLYAVAGGT
jgi:class 3 adenylate cyclase